MSYSRRVSIAVLLSILFHGAFFWLGYRVAEAIPKPEQKVASAPLVFQLEPELVQEQTPDQIKRLISTPNPTTETVEDTDLISDNNSKAQDQSDVEAERIAPSVDEPDEFDSVEQVPSEEQPPLQESMEIEETETPETETQPEVVRAPPTQERTEVAMLPPTQVATPRAPEAPELDAEMPSLESESETEDPEVDSETQEPNESVEETERMQLAQASPPHEAAPPLTQDLSMSRGRDNGSAEQSGVMNFEAKSHELGEYMLDVRRRVERQWHSAIQLRYLGVKRAEATIVCIIRPSGIIEEVRILDPGPSLPFAVLCRDSIQAAGPFNIEIRWKFSYL